MKKSRKGYTLVELLLAMAILSILAASLSALLSTGSNLFANAEKSYQSQIEARTALSYITVKIRQNDASGAIEVKRMANISSLSGEERDVLIIKEHLGGGKCWLIYFENGVLYEKYCDLSSVSPEELHLVPAHVIAEGLSTVLMDEELQAEDSGRKAISVEIEYFDAGAQTAKKMLKSKIALRTEY